MVIENFQLTRHSLASLVSFVGSTMVGPGKFFIIEILRRLEYATLNLVFAINRAILLIF